MYQFIKVSFIPLLLLLLPAYGCHQGFVPVNVQGGGQDSVVIHMPFAYGYQSQCVQGVAGSYSHSYRSTQFDIDFDTPNDQDDDVLAPVSGTVRVHSRNSNTGFGIHVNIDLHDGTYIVLGHLKQVFVEDGSTVWPGDVIGVEGTTGHSTGDHVHIGRHRGRADRDAGQGTSVEGLSFLVQRHGGTVYELPVSQMRCGLTDGEVYISALHADVDLDDWNTEEPESDPEPEPSNPPGNSAPEAEDNKVYVCLTRSSLPSEVNALRLYYITQSQMDRQDPFYDDSDMLFEVYGIGYFSNNWEYLCKRITARDNELILVNGFAWVGDYLGQQSSAYDGKPDWRHFASSNRVYGTLFVDTFIHTDTNGDGEELNDRDRSCHFGNFPYNDVNRYGQTDYASLNQAIVCP